MVIIIMNPKAGHPVIAGLNLHCRVSFSPKAKILQPLE
jgi:hypothetical protein